MTRIPTAAGASPAAMAMMDAAAAPVANGDPPPNRISRQHPAQPIPPAVGSALWPRDWSDFYIRAASVIDNIACVVRRPILGLARGGAERS